MVLSPVDLSRTALPLELGLQRPPLQSAEHAVRSAEPPSKLRPDRTGLREQDSLEISDEAKHLFEKEYPDSIIGQRKSADEETGEVAGQRSKGSNELTDEEQAEVRELTSVDQRVRAHEQAHVAAGGQHIRGGVRYDYQLGPDGKSYAVGGEVSIDSSPAATPEETITKAMQVRAAALAPPDPSPQDMSVAARASQMLADARQELVSRQLEGEEGEGGKDSRSLDDSQPVDPRFAKYQSHAADHSRHIAGVGLDLHT